MEDLTPTEGARPAEGARPRLLAAYLLAVGVSGTATLGALLAAHPPAISGTELIELLVLSALIAAGELFQIKVPRHASELTVSTTFAFAVLLIYGPGAAALALVFASAVADLPQRKGPLRVAFNVGQYALSTAAAALVLSALGTGIGQSSAGFAPADLLPLLTAGVAFFVVNNTLAGTASALATRVPVLALLREDIAFHALTTAMLVGLAPIVVITVDASPFLVPLLAVPIAAVYAAASEAERKDHQSLHDGLTGLPNRTLLKQRATQAIRLARRDQRQVAVIIMDVDRFKDVNDTLGHHYGDLLLKEIGRRVGDLLREGDTVARLGGDEFAVVLQGIRTTADAERAAARIVAALDRPFALERFPLDISASIGIACYPEHGTDVDRLLQSADIAMYVAKESKAGPQVYRAEKDSNSVERLRLAGELRQALDRDDLHLHYQPKVDLRTGRIVAAEALVRWDHAEMGPQTPAEFIDVAEQTGMIRTLTLSVLRQAMLQIAAWRAEGMDIPVFVNVSVRDLERTFPVALAELLREQRVPASSIALEITESVVMADPDRAALVLRELSDMGHQIAIDDFGTGYSSLRYLQQLPVDALKIDRSFVQNMARSDGDAAIVRSTIDLGHHFGLDVVAEGIEDEFTRTRLVRMGCDLAQGYLFAPPLPAGELLELFRAHSFPASGEARAL